MIILKTVLAFWGLFFNCSSIVIEVSEPLFSFLRTKKIQQKTVAQAFLFTQYAQEYFYLLQRVCNDKDSKCVKIDSVNPVYLINKKVNEYFEEINKNKYLTLVPNNKSKEKIKRI